MAARKKAVQIEEGAAEIGAAAVEKEGFPSSKGEASEKGKGGNEVREGMASSEGVLPLEEAFARLDDIMEQLEQEKISLEDSFLLYQQGMKLLKQCNDSIDRVEKQLIILEEEGI